MIYLCPKKHKSMDSDDDDEEPQNEPGTSSTSQPFVPVLPLNQGPAASSQGPAASDWLLMCEPFKWNLETSVSFQNG